MKTRVKILPSLLAGDFGRLADSAAAAERCGGDELHIDIMDAHFVPNLSMGPDVVRMARRTVGIPLSVHLMMSRPDIYAGAFIEAGADALLIHLEAECDVAAVLRGIRAAGAAAGLTLNPETPVEPLFDFVEYLDQVLFMTVHPGFGGQKFIPQTLEKIEAFAKFLRGRPAAGGMDILVDGGIDFETGAAAAGAGANALVAGSFLYRAPDMAAAVAGLREKAEAAMRSSAA